MRRNFHDVREPLVMIIPMIDIMLFLLVFFYLLVVLPVSLLGSRLERRIRHAEFGD